jgi:hypothetical protein
MCVKSTTTPPPIAKRAETHGDYSKTAEIAQHIKVTYRNAPNWYRLSYSQKEALDLITTKIARILSGEPNEPDHWLDIEGYARLARERLGETRAQREKRLYEQGAAPTKVTPCPTKVALYTAMDNAISGGHE